MGVVYKYKPKGHRDTPPRVKWNELAFQDELTTYTRGKSTIGRAAANPSSLKLTSPGLPHALAVRFPVLTWNIGLPAQFSGRFVGLDVGPFVGQTVVNVFRDMGCGRITEVLSLSLSLSSSLSLFLLLPVHEMLSGFVECLLCPLQFMECCLTVQSGCDFSRLRTSTLGGQAHPQGQSRVKLMTFPASHPGFERLEPCRSPSRARTAGRWSVQVDPRP
eukprot:3738463-Rhodomonas_salina.1